MKKQSLKPPLKYTKSNTLAEQLPKLKNLSELRKDLLLQSKPPVFLQDKSDFHKNIVYPHWTLTPNSEKKQIIKRSKSIFMSQVKSKESLLDVDPVQKCQRVPGENIYTGSKSTKHQSHEQIPDLTTVRNSDPRDPIQRKNSAVQEEPKKSVKNLELNCGFRENLAETFAKKWANLKLKNIERANKIRDSSAISRCSSAIVFGNKSTLFDYLFEKIKLNNFEDVHEAKNFIKKHLNNNQSTKNCEQDSFFFENNREIKDFKISSSDCSYSKDDELDLVSPRTNRRSSITYQSELGRSTICSKDDILENLPTCFHWNKKKEIEQAKEPKIEIEKPKNKTKDILNLIQSCLADSSDSKLKLKDLARMKVPEVYLSISRSKSVVIQYSRNTPCRSRAENEKIIEKNDKISSQKPGIKGKNRLILDIETSLKLAKSQQKEIKSEADKNNKKKTKDDPTEQGGPEKTGLIEKNLEKFNTLSSESQINLQNDNRESVLLNSPSGLLEAFQSSEKTPENPEKVLNSKQRISVSLATIYEKPKLKIKKNSLPQNNYSKLTYSVPQRNSLTGLQDIPEFPRFSTDISAVNIVKRRFPGVVPEPPLKEERKSKDFLSKVSRKPTLSERPNKSGPVLKPEGDTEDPRARLVKRKTLVQSSVPFLTFRTKKKARTKTKKTDFSVDQSSSFSEQDSSENYSEKSRVLDPSLSKDRKRKQLEYEIKELSKSRKNFTKKQQKTLKEKSTHSSEAGDSPSKDLQDELEYLVNDKVQIRKFIFSKPVVYRFTQKFSHNHLINEEGIEINDYMLDDENFDRVINKKRFVNELKFYSNRVSSKFVEVLDSDKNLPSVMLEQKLKEIHTAREKQKVKQNRGTVVGVGRGSRVSFSGLNFNSVSLENKRKKSGKEVSDGDIIKCGGSNCVKDEVHESERLYCRFKGDFDLERLSGKCLNSDNRLIGRIKRAMRIVDRVKTVK